MAGVPRDWLGLVGEVEGGVRDWAVGSAPLRMVAGSDGFEGRGYRIDLGDEG